MGEQTDKASCAAGSLLPSAKADDMKGCKIYSVQKGEIGYIFLKDISNSG